MTTEQIWELLGEKLRSFLLQRVSDEQVADDLLQETFMRIHKRLDSLDDRQRIIGTESRVQEINCLVPTGLTVKCPEKMDVFTGRICPNFLG